MRLPDQARPEPPPSEPDQYSPDFNPDEAIWGWARQEVTANLCLVACAAVRVECGGLFHRSAPPMGRSQTPLPNRAANVVFTLASV